MCQRVGDTDDFVCTCEPPETIFHYPAGEGSGVSVVRAVCGEGGMFEIFPYNANDVEPIAGGVQTVECRTPGRGYNIFRLAITLLFSVFRPVLT